MAPLFSFLWIFCDTFVAELSIRLKTNSTMEDQINTEMAIFRQICEINELDPQAIKEEAKQRFPNKFKEGEHESTLIWTAFDHRAKELAKSVGNSGESGVAEGRAYTIDSDPAGPSFTINEEAIRQEHGAEKGAAFIEALRQVKMPVTG
jgi:hypothetical protein